LYAWTGAKLPPQTAPGPKVAGDSGKDRKKMEEQ